MNDNTQSPPGEQDAPPDPGTDQEFDPHQWRSMGEMHRSSDSRIVAGVCTGIARHLNIDPILVRIVFAVLIFVGGSGVILYAAFWFLIPSDDAPKSIAADWFRLEGNEEKVRTGGLVLAAVVAVLTAVGDSGWGWGAGVPWGLLPLALVVYVFVVRPRRRREARRARTAAAMQTPTSESVAGGILTTTYTLPAEPRSWTLTGLTLSVTAIAVAVTRIIADSGEGTPWTTYVAVALAIVAIGLLISTIVGDGGPLIFLGLLLAVALGLGTLLPSSRIGAQQLTPVSAADVSRTYEHGVGLLELDLTGIDDPGALLGRTVALDSGVGQIKIIVPNGLNVAVDAHLDAGEIAVFDRLVNGTDNDLDVPADLGRALTLTIDQKVGNIEVIRQ